jgi:hypothetical protein
LISFFYSPCYYFWFSLIWDNLHLKCHFPAEISFINPSSFYELRFKENWIWSYHSWDEIHSLAYIIRHSIPNGVTWVRAEVTRYQFSHSLVCVYVSASVLSKAWVTSLLGQSFLVRRVINLAASSYKCWHSLNENHWYKTESKVPQRLTYHSLTKPNLLNYSW